MLLSARLKADTQLQHEQAEAHPAMRALVSPALTREAYRRHVLALLRFHAGLEPALAACPGLGRWVPDLSGRGKVAGLRDDARALGVAPIVVERTLGDAQPVELAETADGLGALYVVEGATLGGRLLARRLSESLGLDAASGAAHFHSYGDRRGEMWRRLRAALDAFGAAHPDRASQAVGAARATFSAFTDALPT